MSSYFLIGFRSLCFFAPRKSCQRKFLVRYVFKLKSGTIRGVRVVFHKIELIQSRRMKFCAYRRRVLHSAKNIKTQILFRSLLFRFTLFIYFFNQSVYSKLTRTVSETLSADNKKSPDRAQHSRIKLADDVTEVS